MHKKTTFLRAALCLFLVCCLLVNMSPLKAEASAAAITYSMFSVGADIAVASVLNGLGVMPGDDTAAYDGLVNDLILHLNDLGGFISKGLVTICKVYAALHGYKFYIDQSFIEAVRQYIFGENVVSETVAKTGFAYYNGMLLSVIPGYGNTLPYVYIYAYTNGEIRAEFYNYPVTWSESGVSYDSGGVNVNADMKRHVYNDTTESWNSATPHYHEIGKFYAGRNILWSNHDIKYHDSTSVYFPASDPVFIGIDSSYDLTLGQVVSSGIDFSDGYTTWAEGAVSVPGSVTGSDENDEIPFLPVGLGQNYEETQNKPQADIWEGNSSFDFADAPVITQDLSTDRITYELGEVAKPLSIKAYSTDGGTLSYQWYVWKSEATLPPLIDGAIADTYIPPTDVVGTYHYYCHVINTNASGLSSYVASSTAVIEVVSQAGVDSDTVTDVVTGTGLKGWLDNMLMGVSNFFDSAVTGLLEGLKGLFIPDADALIAQQTKWTDLLAERFGAVYESTEIIDGWANAFTYNGNQTSIYFPALTVNLAGVPFTFGGWYVDVIPAGFGGIIDSLKLIVNIVCTFLFVNGLKKRLEGVVR